MPNPLPSAPTVLSSRGGRWAIPLLALALYADGLSRWPLWEGELWTVRTCAGSFGEMVRLVVADRHPPLFFLVEWLVMRISASDAAVRIVPALAALGAVVVGQRMATRHFGRIEGWFLALLLATSPFVVAYAANARSGSTTILLGLLACSWSLDVVYGRHHRKSAVALGLALGAGLYVHYAMVLAVVGTALGVGLALSAGDRPRRDRASRLAPAALAVFVPVAAFLPWILGPMRHQDLVRVGVARTTDVFRYLWWPVGANYVPSTAPLLLVLAIAGLVALARSRGHRGIFAGWVVAAVTVPYAWSGDEVIDGRYYLYAPLHGPFLLLAAVGLAAVARGVSRVLPVAIVVPALSVGLLLLAARPLHEVLVPRSNLASISETAGGVWDARVDIATFAEASGGRKIPLLPDTPLGQLWLRYDPERFTSANPDSGIRWRLLPRVQDSAARSRSPTGSDGCLLTEAFTELLLVPAQECAPFLAVLAGVGEQEGYGPFLLEAAQFASDRGESGVALELAVKAAAGSPVSARADLLVGRLRSEAGDYGPAATAIADGKVKAGRHGDATVWRNLALLDVEVAEGTGDPAEVARARTELACLDPRTSEFTSRCGWRFVDREPRHGLPGVAPGGPGMRDPGAFGNP